MPDLSGVKAGDALLKLRNIHSRSDKTQTPREVVVHKVGSAWIHVLRIEGRPDLGTDTYGRSDGLSKDGLDRLVTRTQYEEECEHRELDRVLRERGVETYGILPLATLRALSATLDSLREPGDTGRDIRYDISEGRPDGYPVWRIVRSRGDSRNTREINGYTDGPAARRVAATLNSVAHLED